MLTKEYSTNILFMGTVAMVFAPLSPPIAICAAAVFMMSWWVYRQQLTFIFVSRMENSWARGSIPCSKYETDISVAAHVEWNG
jgi:hypothetical protein